MKLKKKTIDAVRIRKDRAERLRQKAMEVSFASGIQVSEADLVNFLIDSNLEKIQVKDDELKIA